MNHIQKGEPVEIVVIADQSGSMARIANDAIGGYNSFVNEQQSVPGEANLTLILFSDQYQVVQEFVPLSNAMTLTSKNYRPYGTTALYDAIGKGLTLLESRNPARAIICIITDGEENASREYDREAIYRKIGQAESRGWQVVYLAANQDAFAVGAKMGVSAANASNFKADSAGVKSAFSAASMRSSGYRTSL